MRTSPPCRAVVAAALLGVAGCATAPPPAASNVPLPFEQAVDAASDELAAQARRLAVFRAGAPRVPAVADPVVEAATGQQTVATARLDRQAGQRLAARLEAIALEPLASSTLPPARFLLTGTLARAGPGRPKGTVFVQLALIDLKTRGVVAQSSAPALAETVDATPLPCEVDSPVRLRDPALDARPTIAATAVGQPAPAAYLDRLGAAARVAEGLRLCNDGQPADAFDRFQRAAADAGGAADAPRVLGGLYVTASRLGRGAEADRAFDQLVGLGLAQRGFDVKFLFNPGSTVLTADGRYPLWLRRIARAVAAAKVCLQVVGHGGSTGTPAAAEALSLQRAAYIRQRLVGDAAVLGARTRAIGVGARQNLVGTGTDDAVDALDRRIEFRVVDCGD